MTHFYKTVALFFCSFRIILTIVLVGYYSGNINAQSEADILQEVVVVYNRLNDTAAEVQKRTDKKSFMDSVYSVSQTSIERLNILRASSDQGIAVAARYFLMNLQYNYAFGFGAAGDLKRARGYYDLLQPEMEYFVESKFPIRYKFFDKNYVINWSNFVPTKAEYLVGYGEILYHDRLYEYAITEFKQAIPLLDSQIDWIKYVCYSFLADSKTSLSQYDAECFGFCSEQLTVYYRLTPEDLAVIEKNKYSTYKKSVKRMDECLDNFKIDSRSFDQMTSAINILKFYIDPYKETDTEQRNKNKTTLLKWYDQGIQSEFVTKEFIKSACAFVEFNAADQKAKTKSWLQRYETLSLTCDDYMWLIERYKIIGDNESQTRIQSDLTKCREQEARAAKLSEEQRAEEEKRRRKADIRSSRMPLIYLGGNVFPYFTKPKDYGLALNVGGKGVIVELSYLRVNGKKENYFDLNLRDINDISEHKWNGYFTHLNLKFPVDRWTDGRNRPYVGFLVAYNERTFDSFNSNVTLVSDGSVSSLNFNPTSKQYLAMVNMGWMGVNVIGIDLFMGFGAAFNQFNGGNQTWNNENYTIEDAMLANRKESYWSFTMRMGMSIGLGYARE